MHVFFSKRQMSRVKTLKKCTVTGICLGGPILNCVQIRSFLPVPFVSFFSMHRQPVMLHNGESDGPCSLHPSFFSVYITRLFMWSFGFCCANMNKQQSFQLSVEMSKSM